MITPSLASEKVQYAIRDVTVLADKLKAEGMRMLYLNIGDPNAYDFDLAPIAKEHIIQALSSRKNGYANSIGVSEALKAINSDAEQRLGIKNILGSFVGNGASECIEMCLSALVNPGENVLLPSPTYPLYTAILGRIGAQAAFYKLDEKNGWNPDVEHMRSLINEKTRAVVIINPNNPTGAVYTKEILEKIVALCKEKNVLLMCDEIYERLILDDGVQHISAAGLDPKVCAVTFNGLSKSFLGPGIRIGWGIFSGPESQMRDYIEAVYRLLRARLCASHPMQYAISACLQDGGTHLPEFKKTLKERRDYCIQRVQNIPGLSCVCPAGSFYAYIKIDAKGSDKLWCKSVLEQTGVVIVPGSGFGHEDPDVMYFRIVFLPNMEVLTEAFDKIEEFMKR